MAAVAKLKSILGLDPTQYKAGIKQAESQTTAFQNKLAAVGKGLAAAFSVGMIINFGKSVIQLGSKITDMAAQTGLSTDQFQALSAAALDAGVESEGLRQVFSKINVTMGQAKSGMKTYVDLFDRVGISQERLSRLDTAGVLEEIAKTFSTAEQGSSEFGAALELIGTRSGAKFTEVLNQISEIGLQGVIDKYKELGMVMSEDVAQSLDRAADAMERFKVRSKVAGAEIVDVLTGSFEAFQLMRETAQERRLEGKGRMSFNEAIGEVLRRREEEAEDRKQGGPEAEPFEMKQKDIDKAKMVNERLRSNQLTGLKKLAAARLAAEEKLRKEVEAALKAGNSDLIEVLHERGQIIQRAYDADVEKFKEKEQKKRDAIRRQYGDKIADLLAGAEETEVSAFAPSVNRGSLAATGGFVGATRGGIDIADRQLKLTIEANTMRKELKKLADERNRKLDELIENTEPAE
jgi:hypothetical protein